MKCPTCGSETTVCETRTNDVGVRRRRICSDVACGHRITTLEAEIGRDPRTRHSKVMLVHRHDLEQIAKLATKALNSHATTTTTKGPGT